MYIFTRQIHIPTTNIVDTPYQNIMWRDAKYIELARMANMTILRVFNMKRAMKDMARIFIRCLSFIFGVVRFRIRRR